MAVALIAVCVLGVSACGSTSASGRPSTADISQALRNGMHDSTLGSPGKTLAKSAADCLAKVLHDSDISDAGLRALVDQKKNYTPTGPDQKAAEAAQSQMVKCLPSSSQ